MYPGVVEFKESCSASRLGDVDSDILDGTKDPNEHVKEMDSDVCGDSTGFCDVALPGVEIPPASRRDICQLDVVLLVFL